MKNDHVLITGAGEAGRMLLREFTDRGLADKITGFADDDPSKKNLVFCGKKVLGTTEEIPALVRKFSVNSIIIAMPSVSGDALRKTAETAASTGVRVSILPQGEQYFDSVPLLPAVQEISVSDLLDRSEYSVDVPAMKAFLKEKKILVTGAGGSIGSEICRQLLKFQPAQITALGRGEYSIYSLINSIKNYTDFMEKSPLISCRIADVKDRFMMERIFREFRPDVVFHAAAHKHVPLMEYNEAEACRNNVIGTLNVLEAAENAGSEFILISTDKAVRPSSVMGATKRLAEILTETVNRRGRIRTAAVRFGNVLGSRGSVIPLFQQQIRAGGPVTVTHPDVSRYFMTIPEAALLVINAGALASGGETFVLDMGHQYRIADVARRLIKMYGLEPDRDIKIQFTGLRPGEKLNEELFIDTADLERTCNNRIFVKRENSGQLSDGVLAEARSAFDFHKEISGRQARDLLKKFVPEYENRSRPADGADRLVW